MKRQFVYAALALALFQAAPAFAEGTVERRACATGQHLPTATLTVRKSGGTQQEYLQASDPSTANPQTPVVVTGQPQFAPIPLQVPAEDRAAYVKNHGNK